MSRNVTYDLPLGIHFLWDIAYQEAASGMSHRKVTESRSQPAFQQSPMAILGQIRRPSQCRLIGILSATSLYDLPKQTYQVFPFRDQRFRDKIQV